MYVPVAGFIRRMRLFRHAAISKSPFAAVALEVDTHRDKQPKRIAFRSKLDMQIFRAWRPIVTGSTVTGSADFRCVLNRSNGNTRTGTLTATA